MKILYTAFNGVRNSSYQLVSKLGKEALYLTNSFQGLEKDISQINDSFDAVYMFGCDKTLSDTVKIETCAQYNGEWINTIFDINTLSSRFRNHRIAYSISDIPSGYLCNAAYYHMLKKIPNTVFIHIPSIKWMDNNMIEKLITLF